MPKDQHYLDTAHLLRRAGFGASPQVIQQTAQQEIPQIIDGLLHPASTPDSIQDDVVISRLTDLVGETKNGGIPLQVVKMWWTHRMVASPHPLVEKMTLFWHGHFTSKLGGAQGDLMLQQNQLFRRNALGNFRTLTQQVSRDPAMLQYLNGNQNFKAHPNENYGRELMELYTCGIGHYTEDDVKAAARAFSGWNLRQQQFFFNANQHDNTPKTFLGKTGNWNGDDIVDILVAHPATANRLCTQLFTYLAYPNPEPKVLDALVKTYYRSGYEISAVVGEILRSQAFWSDKARNAVIKCPAQYVVGTVKMLGLEQAADVQPEDITLTNDMASNPGNGGTVGNAAQRRTGNRLGLLALLPLAMRTMGQDILEPPSVKGWDGNEDWINSSTLLARVNFANQISLSRLAFDGQFAQAASFIQAQNISDAGAWVDYLANTLGPLQITPQSRQLLIDYVNGTGSEIGPTASLQNTDYEPQAVPPVITPPAGVNRLRRRQMLGQALQQRKAGGPARLQRPGPGGFEGRLRGVIPLLMATPEFQVC